MATDVSPLVLLPLDGITVAPLRIASSDVTVGRGPESSARLDVPSISRRHARIRFAEGMWSVEDLGSRHGTWVDGARVDPGAIARLTENSIVAFGPCRFRVTTSTPGSSTMVALSADEASLGRGSTVRRVSEEELSALAKRRLDALLAVSESLQSATSESEIARSALDAMVRGTGFACATWVRLRGDSQLDVLGVMMGSGRSTSEIPVSRTLLRAASEGVIVRLEDQPFLREAESVVAGHITNALCIPVIVGREVDSFLYLASGVGSEPPEDDAATYAAAMARFCALALSSLRRRRLEDQQRALYRELEQAHLVQTRFMPAEKGTVGPLRFTTHSRPGRFVAGDICGVRDLGSNRAFAFLGDVSGKGIGPALLMTSLQSFLDAAAADVEAGDLATRASMHFARYATDSRFATLWLCRADGTLREIECVDAGHGLVVLLRQGKPELMSKIGGGPPLGVVENQVYESSIVRLDPGERVVLVTDGVTEQGNAQGEQFGVERLLAALDGSRDCDEDVARILAELLRFGGTQDFADDVTMMSLAFA